MHKFDFNQAKEIPSPMILPVNASLNQSACMQFPSLCLGNYHLFLKARQLPELVLRATTKGAVWGLRGPLA